MKLLTRIADWTYAGLRSAKDSDSGPCDECGAHVPAFVGNRERRRIYCSDECARQGWLESFV